jgi:hypothetical protein
MNKVCSRCGVEKDASEYYANKKYKDGLRPDCKVCGREYKRQWYEKNLEREKAARKARYAENSERERADSKAWHVANPEKAKEYSRKWRLENPEKNKERLKKWLAENPEKSLASYKRRRENIEKVRELGRIAAAKRYSSPKGKLSINISSRIFKSLKRGTKGSRHWESLVDFTVDQLKAHLEKLFKPGWTWENYGTVWQIDHKTPIAVFNYERPEDLDFRICWSLKNLQPMDATENRIKGDRIDKPFQPSLAMG